MKIDIFRAGEEIIGLGKKVASYDAIFLDADREEMNGLDFGSWLNAAFPKVFLVFVSGCISYALEGYKVGAVRYIMKDAGRFESSMEECLLHILRKSGEDESNYVSIDGAKLRVSVEKILYIDSRAHKITYHLLENDDTKAEYSVYGKLSDIEEGIRDFGFCRIHQSYLVNMNYVREVQRYRVVLLNGLELPVSKKNYKSAEDKFVSVRGTF